MIKALRKTLQSKPRTTLNSSQEGSNMIFKRHGTWIHHNDHSAINQSQGSTVLHVKGECEINYLDIKQETKRK